MTARVKNVTPLSATPASVTRIMLVDDHAMMRRGLTQLINAESGLQVCGEAPSVAEAHPLIGQIKPDLVVADISLNGTDGVEFTKELCYRWPNLRVLIYSMHEESIYAERAIRAGARGYVMKNQPPETLLQAIRHVLQGKVYLSNDMSDRLLAKVVGAGTIGSESKTPIESLSDRELEVFQFIGQGLSTAQIADKLCLSSKTIETYREHLKQKLHLQSGLELIRYAVEWSVKQV
jgi:DNA-binding NarL/FixJ family response regulator